FQAEYEGSIPFTRSNVFKHLVCEWHLLPTNRVEYFRQDFSICLPSSTPPTSFNLDGVQIAPSLRNTLQLHFAFASIVAVQVVAHRLRRRQERQPVSLAGRTTVAPTFGVLRAHALDRPSVASGKCAHTRLISAATISCVSSRETRCRNRSLHSPGWCLPFSFRNRFCFYFFAGVLGSQCVPVTANYPRASIAICSIASIAGQRANSTSLALYSIERVGTC